VSGEHGKPHDAVRQQRAEAGRDAYTAGRDINNFYPSPPAAITKPGHPEADAWVAAIHASPDDFEPLGAGIVLDHRRILTCVHVVAGLPEAGGMPAVWAAFPKAEEDASASTRRRVERVILPDARTPVNDLAILVLAEPVPAGVPPAPLRCPSRLTW
jgi:hypothetical protein